jgi:hypothetical protein
MPSTSLRPESESCRRISDGMRRVIVEGPGEEPHLARHLSIEERELEAGGRN